MTPAIDNADREYLTERDLAALLGVGVSTVQQWRYAGRGPRYVKLGARLVRYHRADVEAWRTANTVITDN
jgi:excisionase family DNA binding protein